MEFGTIEREIYVDASPEIVFEVVSSPDHLRQWWPDEAHYEPVPGSTGEIVYGGGMEEPDDKLHMAQVVCQNCSYVMMFAAIPMSCHRAALAIDGC